MSPYPRKRPQSKDVRAISVALSLRPEGDDILRATNPLQRLENITEADAGYIKKMSHINRLDLERATRFELATLSLGSCEYPVINDYQTIAVRWIYYGFWTREFPTRTARSQR